MANINITSDAWTEISITSGTIQNISATADIELSAEQTDNRGVVLKPSEIYQWDNETIYARAVTEETGALRVVNFKRAAGGGGGYVLPVASSSTLGGVKVGANLSINESGVLSATGGGGVNYSTTEQQIGTWIDGKPLYQKTYQTTTPSTINSYSTIISDLGSINIISINGYLIQMDVPHHVLINTSFGDTLIATFVDYTTLTNASIIMYTTSSVYTSAQCYITLQYTKPTD